MDAYQHPDRDGEWMLECDPETESGEVIIVICGANGKQRFQVSGVDFISINANGEEPDTPY